MASDFSSFFADGRSAMLSVQGESVSYYPPGEELESQTVTAIVGPELEELLQEEDGQTKFRQRFVACPTSSAAGGSADLGRGGRFLIGSDDWTVKSIPHTHGGLARCLCVRPVKSEAAMRGNRSRRGERA